MIYAVIEIILIQGLNTQKKIFNQCFICLITKCIQPVDNYRYSFQLTIKVYFT